MTVAAFETTLQKTHALLHLIEQRMEWAHEDERSLAALRAVLHVLRDRLTVEQAANLAAQFTPLVRGIYYEGYKPESVPQKMHHEEFITKVDEQLSAMVQDSAEDVIHAVISALKEATTKEEFEKIKYQLPEDIKPLFDE